MNKLALLEFEINGVTQKYAIPTNPEGVININILFGDLAKAYVENEEFCFSSVKVEDIPAKFSNEPLSQLLKRFLNPNTTK